VRAAAEAAVFEADSARELVTESLRAEATCKQHSAELLKAA